MEDLDGADSPPQFIDETEPQGNDDPQDPLRPDVEEEDRPPAPLGDPTADVDTFEDDEAPQTVDAMNGAGEDDEPNGAVAGIFDDDDDNDDDDDDESELEELDEKDFEDFDPSALNIPDKPVQVDESNVGRLGVHKRKRTEDEERERKKKKKEGRREKPKRSKKKNKDADADDDDFEGGEELEGKRARKSKVGVDGRQGKSMRSRARTPPEDEEHLTQEERELLTIHLATHEKGMMLTSLRIQAAAAPSTVKWTKPSKPTAPPAAAVASTSKPPPTRRSKACASAWPKPAKRTPTRAPKEKSQHTNSASYRKSSSS